MNEMQADITREQIEASTRIRIAEIEANAKVKAAKYANRRSWSISDEAKFLIGLIALVLLIVGPITFVHVTNANAEKERALTCQASGGTWGKTYHEYKDSRNNDNILTDSEWTCIRP